MFKNVRKKLKNNNGFTILELIVVIAIMGFLVALVAPKLVNVVDNSKEPIAITDMKRLTEIVERYVQENGKLPNQLDSMIPEISRSPSASPYLPPSVQKNGFLLTQKGTLLTDSDTPGASKPYSVRSVTWSGDRTIKNVFLRSFTTRNELYSHALSDDEAKDIRNLGITKIISADDGTEKDVEGGLLVLMIGAGASNNTAQVSTDSRHSYYQFDESSYISTGEAGGDRSSFANPELMYRIVLGIGESSELIKKGYMSNVPVHPKGLQNKDNLDVTGYSLVLPRLKSTITRLNKADPTKQLTVSKNASSSDRDVIKSKVPLKVEVDGYDKGKKIVNGKEIKLDEEQDITKFNIIGIGEEVYPKSDVYIWGISKWIE